MIKTSKPELLAPVGYFENLVTAINFGADAVYLGGSQLQLRADRVGFSVEDISKAVQYTHDKHKKLYVTVNSFANNNEIHSVGDYAKQLKEIGVDALIISDLGVIDTVKKACPDMEVHVSTQANCTNFATANVYYNMGSKRIVLAREMSLEDIIELRQRIPKDMEIEAFVHGAMCMAYSGRCMISSYLTNRNGNRGDCCQPCRWNYYLVEQTRKNMFFPVEETENGTTILSSHDLKCISFLDELEKAGVNSFKIEGRMKSAYYVATVVNAYRRMIDKSCDLETLEYELETISHRPYSSGFYFGEVKNNHNNTGEYSQSCLFVGTVLECKDGEVLVEVRNKINVDDVLEVLSPSSIGENFKVTEIHDSYGIQKDVANRPGEHIYIKCGLNLKKGDLLRKK